MAIFRLASLSHSRLLLHSCSLSFSYTIPRLHPHPPTPTLTLPLSSTPNYQKPLYSRQSSNSTQQVSIFQRTWCSGIISRCQPTERTPARLTSSGLCSLQPVQVVRLGAAQARLYGSSILSVRSYYILFLILEKEDVRRFRIDHG